MAKCAVFSAMLCIVLPFSIPIGEIPVTLAMFMVILTASVLEPIPSLVSIVLYLALGGVGLPVFSGGKGGFAVFLGPTGGYLWGYLPMVLVISLLIHVIRKKASSSGIRIFCSFFAALLGIAICYLIGTMQFCLLTDSDPSYAATLCVYPFIPFDLVKAAAAVYLGEKLHRI